MKKLKEKNKQLKNNIGEKRIPACVPLYPALSSELPYIIKSLTTNIKGLAIQEGNGKDLKTLFKFKGEVFRIKNIKFNEVQFLTVAFQNVKTLETTSCVLYKGRYLIKEDSFNKISYKNNSDTLKATNNLYTSYYYRSKGKVQRKIQRDNERKAVTRVCPYCGKSFTPSHLNQVYCSKECYRMKLYQEHQEALEYRAKNNPLYRKVCPICSKEFIAERKTQKFCSGKCRYTYYNRQAYLKKKAKGE